MRILFVAKANSIHVAQWMSQLADQNWDLHLFPNPDHGLSRTDLRGVTVHHSIYGRIGTLGDRVVTKGFYVRSGHAAYTFRVVLSKLLPYHRVSQLARLIDRLRPHVVHSLDIESGSYLTLEAKGRARKLFPKWIATSRGADIDLSSRLPSYRAGLKRVLAECDFFSCACDRDVCTARSLNLRASVLPQFGTRIGFALPDLRSSWSESTAARRLVMLNGSQGRTARGLVAIRALERCADVLSGYRLVIFSAEHDVALAAELLAAKTGLEVVVLRRGVPHRDILAYHGQARISIGLSISDAISTSFLEAIAMGSFPIQSDTSCADEWAEHGRTALFVPPEDPEVIEAAIRRALADDELVDRAAELNWRTVQERLDANKIKPAVVDLYRRIHAGEPVAAQ